MESCKGKAKLLRMMEVFIKAFLNKAKPMDQEPIITSMAQLTRENGHAIYLMVMESSNTRIQVNILAILKKVSAMDVAPICIRAVLMKDTSLKIECKEMEVT